MESSNKSFSSRSSKRNRILFITIFLLITLGCILLAKHLFYASNSIIPAAIRNSVHFSVYYPDGMPTGYTLNKKSFQLAEAGVVLFTVSNKTGKTIVFTEEQQPSSSEIHAFISSYIPLNSGKDTALGHAIIGEYGKAPDTRAVISLPINDGPWVIATAPTGITQSDLIKIVDSLRF